MYPKFLIALVPAILILVGCGSAASPQSQAPDVPPESPGYRRGTTVAAIQPQRVPKDNLVTEAGAFA